MDFADDVARMVVAWRVRFGVVVRLACPYVARLAYCAGFPPFTGEMSEGQRGPARVPGVLRDVWRIDAPGVPGPAPGQPQGRAPTLRVWHAALGMTGRCARRARPLCPSDISPTSGGNPS